MNSHIQIPKCVLKEFALKNNGYYKYCIETQRIVFGHPKTTFTEEDYYSEEMETILSRNIETPLSKLLTFARELPNKVLPITIDVEISDIALAYAKSLIARNPSLCESVISQSKLGQLLSKRDQHDICVYLSMGEEKMTELFNKFDLSFIVNETNTPFVLGTRGLCEFSMDGATCMISPLNSHCGLIFIEKGRTTHVKEGRPIIFIPAHDDNVVMKINSFFLKSQIQDGRGCVVCHDRAVLEMLIT